MQNFQLLTKEKTRFNIDETEGFTTCDKTVTNRLSGQIRHFSNPSASYRVI